MGKVAAVIAVALALAGCASPSVDSGVPQPNEYEIALENAKDEPFQDCALLAARAGSGVGDLLQDFADAAAVGACYRAKHQSLVDYFKPLVIKARSN